MDTLAFLLLTLPEAPRYFVQLLTFPNGPNGPSKNGGSYAFPTRERAAAYCAKAAAPGWDVYVSMAGFKADAKGHYANSVHAHQAHWIDLDCGPDKPYANALEGVTALGAFLRNHPAIPRPLMVSSGNGLHLYWPYTRSIDIATWRQMAADLRAVFERGGLQIDGKCTIDPARLLRPPGTHNRKDRANPKPVYVPGAKQVVTRTDPAAFAQVLAGYKQQYGITATVVQSNEGVSYDSDLSAGLKEPYSAMAVARECAITRWYALSGGTPAKPGYSGMSNHTWMAVASIYKFSEEGEALFHQHGAQYVPPPGVRGYVRRTAQGLLNRTSHSGARCESLANTAYERNLCACCANRGRITSPVTLGTKRVIMLQQQPVATTASPGAESAPQGDGMFSDTIPKALPAFLINSPYRHTPHGVAYAQKTDDGEKLHHFISHQIVAAQRLWEADGVTQYAFEFETPDVSVHPNARKRTVVLTSEQLGARHGDVNTTLLNNQIVPKASLKANHVMGYINEWVHETLRNENDMLAIQLGFQTDDSFVIGNERFRDGKSAPVYLSAGIAPTAEGFYTKGTLKGWQDAMRQMCEGGELKHMQILLGLAIAFGAPLMKFLPVPIFGALVSFCTGESGRGKTTTSNAMSSVYGEAKKLLGYANNDSDAHIFNTLALRQNLPVVLDESTSADPERLAKLIHTIADGNAPGRANNNGTNRRTLGWRTLAVTSSNHPVSGKLGQNRKEGQGEQARLLEFIFSHASFDTNDTVTRAAVKSFSEENFGHAGLAYVRLLTQAPEQIGKIVEAQFNEIMAGWMTDNAERMWAGVVAVAIAGLRIAIQKGIINWKVDLGAFRMYLYRAVVYNREAYTAKHQPAMNKLLDACSAIMQRHGITVTALRADSAIMPTDEDRTGTTRNEFIIAEAQATLPHELYARHEPHMGVMYIRAATFNHFIGEDATVIRAEAVRMGMMEAKPRQKRLTSGTLLHDIDARFDCYIINHRKLKEYVNPPPEPGQNESNVTPLRTA